MTGGIGVIDAYTAPDAATVRLTIPAILPRPAYNNGLD